MAKQIWAVILAAGQGNRMQGAAPGGKQFLAWKNAPLFWHSMKTLAALPALDGLMLVCPETDFAIASALAVACLERAPLGLPCKIVPGGPRRQDSVLNALAALPGECEYVLVHDSARPFVSAALCQRVLDALLAGHPGVAPGLAVSDTVKEVDAAGLVLRTPERAGLRTVQTPQGFRFQTLRAAHRQSREHGWEVTDDAALLERCAVPVLIVAGDTANRKITNPEDLALLREPTNGTGPLSPCVGFGYDVHSYGGNRPFVLGGVRIPAGDVRIKAHSDGDVLMHALIDALLGCVGGGDIGGLFPDNNPAFENINSALLLAETLEIVRREGLVLTHVDLTVVAQSPKISPFRREIARNIAHLLQLPEKRVNVKATTEEGLGFTGAGLGIKAMAAVTGFIREINSES
ncbi:MAG: 2-C-methyl-D-erythritol 4-phosphate cytidylyltransferase [Deltaproteobacteria bacterium]|jgi:2-C-methyl-D-erythritol 4-phosphate cytidylyltransferase/2-C-methyl-D-erythritol 2,4-cyclodiphosphate synthase|nr:2-C-methyl-D-erythritol 4-phosphate cytidylyltransferase [Deltaproteobacteria bacterium]